AGRAAGAAGLAYTPADWISTRRPSSPRAKPRAAAAKGLRHVFPAQTKRTRYSGTTAFIGGRVRLGRRGGQETPAGRTCSGSSCYRFHARRETEGRTPPAPARSTSTRPLVTSISVEGWTACEGPPSSTRSSWFPKARITSSALL